MPYALIDLKVNRVDLVDEGANSAAFIELYKRKEIIMTFEEVLAAMKPEHLDVINKTFDAQKSALDTTAADLAKAKADLAKALSDVAVHKANALCKCDGTAGADGMCSKCGYAKANDKDSLPFDDEETMKSLPASVRQMLEKMKIQKEVAEAELVKAKEAEKNAAAVSKAASLKALPVSTDDLVSILKDADPKLVATFEAINAAIEATVLSEVGKADHTGTKESADIWTRIEGKAEEIAKADGITKEAAIAEVIAKDPTLYREYLKKGAN